MSSMIPLTPKQQTLLSALDSEFEFNSAQAFNTSAGDPAMLMGNGSAFNSAAAADGAQAANDLYTLLSTPAGQQGSALTQAVSDVMTLFNDGQRGLATNLEKFLATLDPNNSALSTDVYNVMTAAQQFFNPDPQQISTPSVLRLNSLTNAVNQLQTDYGAGNSTDPGPMDVLASNMLQTYKDYATGGSLAATQLGAPTLEDLTATSLAQKKAVPSSIPSVSDLYKDYANLKSVIAVKDNSGHIQSYVGITNANPPEPQIYDAQGRCLASSSSTIFHEPYGSNTGHMSPTTLFSLPGGASLLYNAKNGYFQLATGNNYISQDTVANNQGDLKHGLTALTNADMMQMQKFAPGANIFGAILDNNGYYNMAPLCQPDGYWQQVPSAFTGSAVNITNSSGYFNVNGNLNYTSVDPDTGESVSLTADTSTALSTINTFLDWPP